VNNGAVTRQLVVPDRDGIILKDVKPVAAPQHRILCGCCRSM
jgi:hypothetical protein